jgi:hypothetical protein
MARQVDIDEANKDENKVTEKGIKWDRSCTDILCCLIFTAFIVVMIGLSGYALNNGDPMKILTPFDSVGNKCGQDGQGVELIGDMTEVNTTSYAEYPYKYFTNLVPSSGSDAANIFNAVCVRNCPKKGDTIQCMPNSDVTECGTAFFDTTFYGSFCVPEADDVQAIFEQVYKAMNKENNIGKYISDIQNCW